MAAALLCALVAATVRAIDRGRADVPVVAVTFLLVAAGGLAWTDLTVLVALYAQAHALLEVATWALAGTALALACYALGRSLRHGRAVLGIAAAVALLWGGLWLRDKDDRYEVDSVLALSRRHSGYATRLRLRAQMLRDYLRDPANWKGAQEARVDRLKRRYDIVTTAQAPKWDLPRKMAIETDVMAEDLNIVVVFIDTLRADVAADRNLMPELAKLRARSLVFDNAYAAASDTVSVLPVLTGGCYSKTVCEGDILKVVRERGIPSGLVIAKSARRFLAKFSPHFAFDDVVEIVDYAEGKKVWGYGADQSTASQVSEASLKWIDAHPDQPFFLWSFHFDVHNSLGLDRTYMSHLASRYAHSTRASELRAALDRGGKYSEKLTRYLAATRGVDLALGKLLEGLQARGLADKTAVVVVSDHGEGLGRAGHWQHAVYLWDELVRVPLVVQIPGVSAAHHSRPVGHVDVAPTLLRLLDPQADLSRYHGHPLQRDSSQHDLPLLMFSMRKNDLLRVGVVGRKSPPMKLELPIDSVEPELYDGRRGDEVDVRDSHSALTLSLLAELLTSPIFPRAAEGEKADGDATATPP